MLLNSCQCMANSSFLLFKFSGIIFPNISDPQNIGWNIFNHRYRNYGDKRPTLAGALWDKDKIWGCSQCSCLCFWFPSASICHRDYFLKAIDGDQWLWLLTPFLYPQKVWRVKQWEKRCQNWSPLGSSMECWIAGLNSYSSLQTWLLPGDAAAHLAKAECVPFPLTLDMIPWFTLAG